VGEPTNEDDTGGGHVAQIGEKKIGGRVQEGDQREGAGVNGTTLKCIH